MASIRAWISPWAGLRAVMSIPAMTRCSMWWSAFTWGGDRCLKVKEHLFPRANQGLEKARFSRAGSRDGGAYLLLTGRRKGPPGGLGQRFADHLLASDVRAG